MDESDRGRCIESHHLHHVSVTGFFQNIGPTKASCLERRSIQSLRSPLRLGLKLVSNKSILSKNLNFSCIDLELVRQNERISQAERSPTQRLIGGSKTIESPVSHEQDQGCFPFLQFIYIRRDDLPCRAWIR